MGKRFSKRAVILAVIAIFLISFFVPNIKFFKDAKEIDRNKLQENLKLINQECNSVYKDIEGSEKKYKDLLENTEDYFKSGMYCSCLVQVYTVKNDYKNVMYYAKEAIEYYRKVQGGEYYAIAENKYLAWIMLKIGSYSDTFSVTNALFEMLNSTAKEFLTEEEIIDTEVLIYSIFLTMYSDLEIMDMAENYYNKLCALEIPNEIMKSRGDKVYYSKYLYATKIKDANLISKYAYECYNFCLEKDKEQGTEIVKSVLLNVANADILMGKYDNVLNNIKEAEDYYTSLGDEYGIGNVYYYYGKYYDAIGEVVKANSYYEKSIEKIQGIYNDYSIIDMLCDYMDFLQKNDMKDDLDKYYKIYYEKVSGNNNNGINELITEMVETNEELNESRITYLKNQANKSRERSLYFIILIVALVIMLIWMTYLIKKKNKTEKILEEMANKDYLTGASTRIYGEKLVDKLIKNGENFSIALLDIDDFKHINDTYGHMFGDEVLRSVSQEMIRSVSKDSLVIRFGGEEFIIVFIDVEPKEAKAELDKIRENIRNINFKNPINVSFSAGIREWDNTDLKSILEKADKLLYKAKNTGKNRVEI